MADLTKLQDEVAAETDVTQSAIKLLENLSAEIKAAGTDQAALDSLVQQLDAQKQALADAVVANTPVAPAPPAPTGP